MNFPANIFAGERFAIVGLGRNGLPAARALVAMGAEVTAWDDSEAARAQAGDLHVAVPVLDGLSALVLSPGIAHSWPQPHPIAAAALATGVPILSDADLLFRAVRASGSRAKFVGITGTNGKSTTTALLAHIIASSGGAVAAGGNLGAAALSLPLLGDNGVYVLEMSSYMLERIAALRFDAAVMINLSPDHIDRHGDMAGYAAAKRQVFARQVAGDTAVIGMDDAVSRAMAAWLRTGPARVIEISSADFVPGLDRATALPGAHNAQNAAAATALAGALAVAPDMIAGAVTSFPGLAHRQELVAEIDGVRFVNDSKATNAESVERALACYGRVVWIAGGLAKAGGIDGLVAFFPRVAHALLIGRDAPALAATLAAHGVSFEVVDTLERAVAAAWACARTGVADVVLLSPACASFDQFSGFEARGEQFRALALRLSQAAVGRAA